MAEARRSPAGLVAMCVAGVVLLTAGAFLAGMHAGIQGAFPCPQVNAAYTYLIYLTQLARRGPYRDDEFHALCPTSTGPQTGSGHVLLTLFNGKGYEARIIARDGATKQQWKLDLAVIVARNQPAVEWMGWKNYYRIHGVHLTPEGELYLAISATEAYPAGMVLARVGADGAVRWTAPINAHHDVAVSVSGKVYALGMRPRVPPVAEEDRGRDAVLEVWSFIKRHDFYLQDSKYDDHFIAVLGQDGSIIDEINLREALSTFPGVYVPSFEGEAARSSDPMHANALDVIETETSLFQKGDILVSFRNLNALAVIDGATHKAKWMLWDLFVTQHGAKVTSNGDFLVLDNLGGRAGCGPTRAMLIDPLSQAIRKVFELCGPGAIASAVRGNVHLTADGGALITSTQQGRVVELDGETGAVRWEYYNILGRDPERAGYCRLGAITEAVPLDRPLVAGRTDP